MDVPRAAQVDLTLPLSKRLKPLRGCYAGRYSESLMMRWFAAPLLLAACTGDGGAQEKEKENPTPTTDTETTDDDTTETTESFTTVPVDSDGDGHSEETDCNDGDASVFPGAIERCNGLDDDCDGVAELDEDADGFWACEDCDDADAAIHPGALERCNGGIDDACDGGTDDMAISDDSGQAWATLQAALDGAADGAEIVVCPGTYTGPFTTAKSMSVVSSDGQDVTILDGGKDELLRVDHDLFLQGVTLEGGGTISAAAVVVEGAALTCVDSRVRADPYRGAFQLMGPDAEVELVDSIVIAGDPAVEIIGGGTFRGGRLKDSVGYQGSAAIISGGGTLVGTEIFGSVADDIATVLVEGDASILDCDIHDNSADYAGAGVTVFDGTVDLTGTEIYDNDGSGLFLDNAVVTGGTLLRNFPDDVLVFADATVVGTVMEGDGGGTAVNPGGLVTLQSVQISNYFRALDFFNRGSSRIEMFDSSVTNSYNAVYLHSGGTIAVTNSDLGVGPSDNNRDVEGEFLDTYYEDYGTSATFECTIHECTPEAD